jgi:hypothetical protein
VGWGLAGRRFMVKQEKIHPVLSQHFVGGTEENHDKFQHSQTLG